MTRKRIMKYIEVRIKGCENIGLLWVQFVYFRDEGLLIDFKICTRSHDTKRFIRMRSTCVLIIENVCLSQIRIFVKHYLYLCT